MLDLRRSPSDVHSVTHACAVRLFNPSISSTYLLYVPAHARNVALLIFDAVGAATVVFEYGSLLFAVAK